MRKKPDIPSFGLFEEAQLFPDVAHCEKIFERAKGHEWIIAPHRHTQMVQVFYIRSGSANVAVDGQRILLRNQSFLYIPPGVVHGFTFERDTDGFVLSLPLTIVASLGPKHQELTLWLESTNQGRVSTAMSNLFDEVSALHVSSGTFRAQKLVALTHLMLASLAETDRQTLDPIDTRCRRIGELSNLISQDFSRQKNTAELAAKMNMTAGNLNRVVRSETGMTLSSYIETAVMTEACRQLAFTRMPVFEIAFRLGYTEASYFSRRFRNRIGISPSDYRTKFCE